MKTRKLGPEGVEVSAIGLGGMPMSLQGRPDEAHCIAVIHAALDAGITLIDTADVYCIDNDDIGHNERLIAKALAAWPTAEVFIATKGGLERPGGAWVSNGHPEHLRAACERSLNALGVERIDLYQLHAPDASVPFSDSVGALADLQRAGKIAHIGLSNVDVAQIREAQDIATIASVQNRCNLFDTDAFENGVVAYCQAQNIAFLPHSPVGGHRGHSRLDQHEGLSHLAARLDITPYELALAYLLALSPVVIPIPGASKTSSVESSARAADIALDDAVQAELARMFPNTELA
ncbi:aldo/keto reductase [Haliangium ochraceum]|uniref:Aldo/keto reductase n=1 Tax=Haliangium ochraceum (strain DSM 14365 / JCM 11303 / SMP-2) TaxID=502025 RepID=D0LXR2_HALO1|nr:aldo/keto reductase [Haliangium ochraceum]ACY17817.1 aldo/keto reductase [Haliangium ochraceum DSM 14365]